MTQNGLRWSNILTPMSNITKTIKENQNAYKQMCTVFNIECREPTQGEIVIESAFEKLLLQSQIRLIDSWIEEMKKEKDNWLPKQFSEAYEDNKMVSSVIQDQISSLEEVKKEFLNN